MDASIIGESAAIATAILWTACSILFASAGKRIGALSVNSIRIVIAVGLLAVTHIIVLGTLIPTMIGSQWFYLGLSGIVGLALGDFGYFGTLVVLGPRRGVLLMSMAPIFSTVSACFILDEILGIWTLLGISITLIGVFIVIMEREKDDGERLLSRKMKIYGVLLGIGGAVGQGLGAVISRYGMFLNDSGELSLDDGNPLINPLSATLIRMLAASVFIWIVVFVMGKTGKVMKATRDRGAMKRVAGGAFAGPFIGVWLSMVAMSYVVAGVASTLMALMPVLVIPFVWIIYRERTNWRGILGALVAVAGVAVLFLT